MVLPIRVMQGPQSECHQASDKYSHLRYAVPVLR
jgi:hypothetical protein